MKNISISDCDVYRDGGSIGLFFSASGGKEFNLSFSEFREQILEWIDVDLSIASYMFTNWIRRELCLAALGWADDWESLLQEVIANALPVL